MDTLITLLGSPGVSVDLGECAGCTETFSQLKEQGSDFILSVKDNGQSLMHRKEDRYTSLE